MRHTVRVLPLSYIFHSQIFLGPIVRIAPNLLSFSDPVLLPEVYHGRANKSTFYSSWLFGNVSSMFLTLGHDEHAAKSKIVSPCVSLQLTCRLLAIKLLTDLANSAR